ncbi:MAG: hypothetical protein AAF646_08495 [Pseudomonadota bacterium]
MLFAILLSFGLSLLIAASMARQLIFRGGRIVALVAAALMATAVAVLLSGAGPTPAFVSALVGAGLGTALTRRE